MEPVRPIHSIKRGGVWGFGRMSDPAALERRLEQMQDSLDSMHSRLDKFYSWAGQLQAEFRSMKQRTGFLEGATQDRFDFTQAQQPKASPKKVFGGDEDDALWARMVRITGQKPP